MDIFDEQAPFTVEQLEYLRTRFVSKNTAISEDRAKSISRQMSNTIALDFLQRLTIEGGAIVCSEACEDWELAAARSENRFFVDENNYGYVLRLERWRSLAEKSLGIVRAIESASDGCIENLVSEVKQIYANDN